MIGGTDTTACISGELRWKLGLFMGHDQTWPFFIPLPLACQTEEHGHTLQKLIYYYPRVFPTTFISFTPWSYIMAVILDFNFPVSSCMSCGPRFWYQESCVWVVKMNTMAKISLCLIVFQCSRATFLPLLSGEPLLARTSLWRNKSLCWLSQVAMVVCTECQCGTILGICEQNQRRWRPVVSADL